MSDKSLQEWLDNLPAGAYTCDPEGLITGFNGNAVKLWGRAPRLNSPENRFCGSFQMLAGDDSPLLPQDSCMARVLSTGEECTGSEITFQWEDGRRVCALVNARPLRDNLGKLSGGIGVLMDVGQQDEARKKLEKDIIDYRRTELLIHESNEEEQHLIMHVLHEDVGQRFTGIALLAGVLQKSLTKESHPLAKRADEVSKLAGVCIAIASDLARGFYPLNIEVEGLLVALEFLAQRTESHFQITCKVLRDESCQFVKKQSIHIYRIVEIAILGAIQNFGAKKITVECGTQAGVTAVRIVHDVSKRLKPWSKSGVELDLLNSRARLIDASIEIRDEQTRSITLTLAGE